MRLNASLRGDAAISGLFITVGFCLAASANTQGKFGSSSGDDGTYSIQTVTSLEACKALCKADSQTCRGTVIYQADVTKPEMECHARLNRASEVHAKDLAQAGIISHTGTDGSGHGDRVQRQGYYFSIAGENVATGQMSWDDVFDAWKKSPGHNENLLRDDVSEFGLALIYEPTTTYSTYWAMLVAHPLDINHSTQAQ